MADRIDENEPEDNPPTPDRVLRQAERILAADPAMLDQFLEGLLFTGQLPIPLIHKIHAELLRYDLMEKLPVWVAEVRVHSGGSRHALRAVRTIGSFGTRMRALAAAGAEGANEASRYGPYQWIADRINSIHEAAYDLIDEDPARAEALFQEAVDLFNAEAPVGMVRVVAREGHIE